MKIDGGPDAADDGDADAEGDAADATADTAPPHPHTVVEDEPGCACGLAQRRTQHLAAWLAAVSVSVMVHRRAHRWRACSRRRAGS